MVRKTVLLDEQLVEELTILSRREDRDFSSAMRYSLRIGLIALQNPDLTVTEIKDILEARAEIETGRVTELDLAEF